MDKFEAMKKMLGGDKEARSFLESIDPDNFKSEDKPYDKLRRSVRAGNDTVTINVQAVL